MRAAKRSGGGGGGCDVVAHKAKLRRITVRPQRAQHHRRVVHRHHVKNEELHTHIHGASHSQDEARGMLRWVAEKRKRCVHFIQAHQYILCTLAAARCSRISRMIKHLCAHWDMYICYGCAQNRLLVRASRPCSGARSRFDHRDFRDMLVCVCVMRTLFTYRIYRWAIGCSNHADEKGLYSVRCFVRFVFLRAHQCGHWRVL